MLGRYHMRRGRPSSDLPEGVRQDTRMHTRHVLRPERDAVTAYLAGALPWEAFATRYRAVVAVRMSQTPAAFDAIAELAEVGDVWLGCSCPTRANPDVRRCHTWLALELMAARYPHLEVRFPS